MINNSQTTALINTKAQWPSEAPPPGAGRLAGVRLSAGEELWGAQAESEPPAL